VAAAPPREGFEVFLQPGEWYFDAAGVRLRTVLGSCIALTLWHRRRRIGGMCHYMLPSRARVRDVADLDGRYGDEALGLLEREAARFGTRLAEYEVKLFGGASMFGSLRVAGAAVPAFGSVPERNVEQARLLVARHGLKVRAESLGGLAHRQVVFDIESGDVWLRTGAARDYVALTAGEPA
jgi:chemotaxis protein CheD